MAVSRPRTDLTRATTQRRESKYVDFKEAFDPRAAGEWCELIKDLAAIANSGGGLILIGMGNKGLPSGADVSPVLALDPAVFTDKLFKYTGTHVAGFDVHEVSREGHRVAAIAIEGVADPIVFTRPGTYEIVPGTQKTAFSKGTIYFRHGAKSEPAVSDDLRDFIAARLEAARLAWSANIRRVIEAPGDAQVAVYRQASSDTSGAPTRIQLTTDPNAPVYGKLDADDSHPYRQTDLVAETNRRLKELGKPSINRFDMQALRVVHSIDQVSAPQFCHQPKFASMQYSDGFIEWLLGEFARDDRFFTKARARYQERRRSSR